eukprot:Gb_38958 [translate_table: standard]
MHNREIVLMKLQFSCKHDESPSHIRDYINPMYYLMLCMNVNTLGVVTIFNMSGINLHSHSLSYRTLSALPCCSTLFLCCLGCILGRTKDCLGSADKNYFLGDTFKVLNVDNLSFSAPKALRMETPMSLEYWAFEILVLLAGMLPNSETNTSLIAICVNTEALAYMVTFGFSAAVSTRVSNELGAKDPYKAKSAVFLTLKLAILQAAIIVGLLLFGHNTWASAFSDSKKIKREFAVITPLLGTSIFFDAIQGVVSGVARGCGWQHLAAWTNLMTFYGIGMPIAIVLAFVRHLNGKDQKGVSRISFPFQHQLSKTPPVVGDDKKAVAKQRSGNIEMACEDSLATVYIEEVADSSTLTLDEENIDKLFSDEEWLDTPIRNLKLGIDLWEKMVSLVQFLGLSHGDSGRGNGGSNSPLKPSIPEDFEEKNSCIMVNLQTRSERILESPKSKKEAKFPIPSVEKARFQGAVMIINDLDKPLEVLKEEDGGPGVNVLPKRMWEELGRSQLVRPDYSIWLENQMESDSSYLALLGRPWLRATNVVQHWKKDTFTLVGNGKVVTCPMAIDGTNVQLIKDEEVASNTTMSSINTVSSYVVSIFQCVQQENNSTLEFEPNEQGEIVIDARSKTNASTFLMH